jgi:catechol 2,3-dioxygenase-like lactoylglutathione lyase family enzyme
MNIHPTPTESTLTWLNGGRVFDQVGFVVADMHEALRFFTRALGIGPWRVFPHGPGLTKAQLWGAPVEWTVWLAFSPWDSRPQIELIQPVSGSSIHQQFLDEGGIGVHHYGLIPADYDAAYGQLVDQGFVVAQESAGYGASADGRNAYFDTRKVLFGAMLELFVPPTQRPDLLEEWSLSSG